MILLKEQLLVTYSVPHSAIIREVSSCSGGETDPQLDKVQRSRDLGTLSRKWDVTPLSLGTRELSRRERAKGL